MKNESTSKASQTDWEALEKMNKAEAGGRGYQTLINERLKESIRPF